MRNIISILLLLFLLLLAGGSGQVLAQESGGYDRGAWVFGAVQTLTASQQINCNDTTTVRVAGSGVVDLISDPQILAANTGKYCLIFGTSDVNTLKLDNGAGITMDASCTLDAKAGLLMQFDGTNWRKIAGTGACIGAANADKIEGIDVVFSSLTDGDILRYDLASGQLKNVALPTANVTVKKDGSTVGTQPNLNFLCNNMNNITCTIAADAPNTEIEIEFDAGVNTRKKIHYVEDFLCGSPTSAGDIGCLGQSSAHSGGSMTYIAGEAHHPGILEMSSSATSGNRAGVRLVTSANYSLLFDYDYDLLFIVKTGASNADVTYRCGIFDPSSQPGASALMFEYDTVDAHTQWHAINRSGNTETSSDTAMSGSIATDTWYVFRLVKTGTTVTYSGCSGNGCTLAQIASYANINVPTGVNTTIGCHVITNTTADKKFLLDLEDIVIEGINR